MSQPYTQEEYLEVVELIGEEIRAKAKAAKDSARYSGAWNDGGSEDLLTKLSYFNAGVMNKIPADYASMFGRFLKQIRDQRAVEAELNNPDYLRYLELHQQFKHLPEPK